MLSPQCLCTQPESNSDPHSARCLPTPALAAACTPPPAIGHAATRQVAIRTSHWTVINHALIWGTLALWLPFLGVLQGLCGSVPSVNPLCGLGPELLGSAGFWLGAVLGAPAAALLADYAIMVFQRLVAPRASQLLQVNASGVPKFDCRWRCCSGGRRRLSVWMTCAFMHLLANCST